MSFAPHLRFFAAAPLLVTTALLACTRAQADVAERFAASGKAAHTMLAHSMDSEPGTCEIDQTKPRRHDPLEPRALPSERARPVTLDGVTYFDTRPYSSTFGVRRAAVSQCPVHPKMWELGVIPRRIVSPRYY
jgi:hypothetical protein